LGLAHLISTAKHLEGEYLREKQNANQIREGLICLICRVMQNENQLDENMEWVGSDVFNKQINRDTYWQLLSEKSDPIPLPKKN
jgi:hypothetical protein